MKKEDALVVWKREFGDVDFAHDFSGKKIKRADYQIENQVGWVVSYIMPLNKGGKDTPDNMIILNHATAYEKGDLYPLFEVVGTKYEIKYDSADDFYYIERIIEE